MPYYLVELSHGSEHVACVRALRAIEQSGSHFVTQAHWGCKDGVHSGWLIADVDGRDDAARLVPPEFRQEARIVELNKFTREGIAALVAELESEP